MSDTRKSFLSMMDAVDGILNQKKKVDEPVAQSKSQLNPFLGGKVTSDIKDIKVPDQLVENIISFATKTPAKKVIEKTEVSEPIVEEKLSEVEILEERMTSLIAQLTSLLKEAKEVMNEMTTVGTIGTNQKFTLKKKAKDGLNKTNKRN